MPQPAVPGLLLGQRPNLYDPASGAHLGVIDHNGREQLFLTPAQQDHLLAPGVLSGVLYDGSNRAIAWTIDGTNYTAAYSDYEIVVAGSDGTVTRIARDPANRITGVTPA